MRRLCYISGTRADFGLMQRALAAMAADARLEVSVCATGMHLSPEHGATLKEIEAAGLRICARVPASSAGRSGVDMARAIGQALLGMVDVLQLERPDAVIVLGDRGEMLAGAVAAIHLNIPVIHIHGGERSGTVDEPIRHAISKLAHLHCASTEAARERLVRMGERPEHVFVTGAPGLDGLESMATVTRAELCHEQRLDPRRPVAIVVFHPVLQEATEAGAQMAELMDAVLEARLQALCFTPNSDAGSAAIREVLSRRASHPDVRVIDNMPRARFVSWMRQADAMAGNSSSGIIEAASLGLPVVNVGARQASRERSENVIDVPIVRRAEIVQGLARARDMGRKRFHNVYGDGRASARIVYLLSTFPLDASLLNKTNAY